MGRFLITNKREDIDFEIGNDRTARTVQNAKNLLMTQMGEVPYDRTRGVDPALYHLPMGDMLQALMPELDRTMMWEPDAHVVSADARIDEQGEVLITAVLEVDEETED